MVLCFCFRWRSWEPMQQTGLRTSRTCPWTSVCPCHWISTTPFSANGVVDEASPPSSPPKTERSGIGSWDRSRCRCYPREWTPASRMACVQVHPRVWYQVWSAVPIQVVVQVRWGVWVETRIEADGKTSIKIRLKVRAETNIETRLQSHFQVPFRICNRISLWIRDAVGILVVVGIWKWVKFP